MNLEKTFSDLGRKHVYQAIRAAKRLLELLASLSEDAPLDEALCGAPQKDPLEAKEQVL